MKADRLRGKKTDIVLDYVLDKPSKHHGERTVPSAFVHRHSIRRTVFLTRSVPQPVPSLHFPLPPLHLSRRPLLRQHSLFGNEIIDI